MAHVKSQKKYQQNGRLWTFGTIFAQHDITILIFHIMKLNDLYEQIMGSSESGNKNLEKEQGFYSLYDKAEYETHTYSNLSNVKL